MVPCAVSIAAADIGVARTVGLAFAVAASTFCPLLLLGIWWRGLTAVGAVAGLLVGGLGSGAGDRVDAGVEHDVRLGGGAARPAGGVERPARARHDGRRSAWLTRDRRPAHAHRFMVRLHAPEAVALDRG